MTLLTIAAQLAFLSLKYSGLGIGHKGGRRVGGGRVGGRLEGGGRKGGSFLKGWTRGRRSRGRRSIP